MATKTSHRSANILVNEQLKKNATQLEKEMDSHVLTWWGPLQPPVDRLIRHAIEYRVKEGPRRRRLTVVLQTPGGYIETAFGVLGGKLDDVVDARALPDELDAEVDGSRLVVRRGAHTLTLDFDTLSVERS